MSCNSTITYKKAIPSEIINIGDLIIVDLDTLKVRKSTLDAYNDWVVNSRLVVGVCSDSNNTAPLTGVIHGGNAFSKNVDSIDGGLANVVDRLVIAGGTSFENPRNIIDVIYQGKCSVNITGIVNLGDKLTISEFPGKAEAIYNYGRPYYLPRPIGKVIELSSDKTTATILLNIE